MLQRVFRDIDSVKYFSSPQDKYVVVSAEKVSTNIVFGFTLCFVKELGVKNIR